MTTLTEQNRTNQQRHREKIISQLCIDEYRGKKAEEMRLYRTANAAEHIIDIPKKSVVIAALNTNTKTIMKQSKGLKYKFKSWLIK